MNTLTLSRRIVAALDPDGTLLRLRRCKCPNCLTGDPYTKRIFHGDKPYHEWTRTCPNCNWEGLAADFALNVPDLAQPENLHLLLEVARSFKCQFDIDYFPLAGIATEHQYSFKMTWPIYGERYHNADLSLAILAAVCAALGIEVEA